MSKAPFIELKDIVKDFSGVKALQGVSFTMGSEVRALVGENGAGKSTLMKILSGVYSYGNFQGKIFIEGVEQRFNSPDDAAKAKVAIIHQELSFFSSLSVGENLLLGRYPKTKIPFLIDWKMLFKEAKEILQRLGLDHIDVHSKMSELSVGNQQLVEMAKVTARDARLIIFDEPTSALSPGEVEKLFKVIGDLKRMGKGIIYISHKLEEVYALADSITVLRDGASVITEQASKLDRDSLIKAMVGRELVHLYPKRKGHFREELALKIEDSWVKVHNNTERVKTLGPFSLELRKGEILGLAGLLGAGRTEFFEAMMGGGKWSFEQKEYPQDKNRSLGKSPKQAMKAGLIMLHEDRRRSGNLSRRSILENAAISHSVMRPLLALVGQETERVRVQEGLSRFRTKYHTLNQEIQTLSGGNQQKVLFERALETGPRILLLDEPTRGVDVGARHEIYEILFDLADQGMAIMLASSDLGEILGLCDRVAVFSRGKLQGILQSYGKDGIKLEQSEIMKLATRE